VNVTATPLPSYAGSAYDRTMSQPYSGYALTDQTPKTGQAVVGWILTLLTGGYMLPWAIAATRGKSNSAFIGWLTFLLGWTLVGWVIALVMACQPHRRLMPRY
jgi:hypothetical protein